MNRSSRLLSILPLLITSAALLWAYASTLAPGLTWANSGADGGDLATAAATGGVPHPTGYPVYLLLAGIFQRLPVGPLAFRTNLLSMAATIVAASVVYALTVRLLASAGAWTSRFGGVVAALAYGLSPMVWSQAVITEVYALHGLFLALLLYLSNEEALAIPARRLDALNGLALGLALGNHVTAVFLLPVVFLAGIRGWASLFRRAVFFIIGLIPYLILPLRAMTHPPVSWGDASTWDGFIWLISGRLYQDELFSFSAVQVWARTQSAAALLLEQFGIPGVALGLFGAVVFASASRLHKSMIWLVLISFVFAIFYVTRDSFVYLLPAFLCFAVWIGVACGRLMESIPIRYALPGRLIASLTLTAALVVWALGTFPQVDASQDARAETFGPAVLSQLPQGALVFTKTDEAVFALWYFHYALGERPDVVVVASDLLHHAWYQTTLRATYDQLNVPGPFPFEETIRQANPLSPACYVDSSTVNVLCLPPAAHGP